MILRIVLCSLLLVGMAACSDNRKEILKSPCAGAEGSPCGPKRSVNDWWMA